ncbi:MAG: hypothetical protein LM587_01035 [Candidatus Aenigmarchaeota archaeon]|nr:hypothetical protein [Candidatus Aenigmarchaeota archaeon]
MDESQQKIEDKLLEILSKEILSISELSRRLNVKRYILAGYLEALREQGKVDVFKVGKAKVYVAKEKTKKGLWLIFFLALIPFFLPMPTLADISVNFTPSNKIWIIDINGNLMYLPEVLNVGVYNNSEQCNIISSYLNVSTDEGYNKISLNYFISNGKLVIETKNILRKEVISEQASYYLHSDFSCRNGNSSDETNLNVSYLSIRTNVFDRVTTSNTIYEDSDVVARIYFEENGVPVDVSSNILSVKIDNNQIKVLPIYNSNLNSNDIYLGQLPQGTHKISITLSYKDLTIPVIQSVYVTKKISIDSISSRYLYPNATLLVYLNTSIQQFDLNSLAVFIDNTQAKIVSISGNAINILAPSLSPGEHTLTVRYGNYSDSTKVYYVSKITGKLLDDSKKAIFTRFTLFKDGNSVLSTTTNSSGDYEIALPPGYYDLKVEFPQATLYFKNFYFRDTDGLINYVYKDSVPIKGLRVYGFYIFEFSGDYSSVSLDLRYSKMNVEDEDSMKVFYCSNWNFASNSCNSNWKILDFTLDKINSKVSLNLDHLSAFVVGREVSLKVACSINKNSFYINETASISCLVEDEDGDAVENASITLNFKGKVINGKTDANGIFTYEYLVDREGNFNVSVSAYKNPYLNASNYFTFSAEKKKEIFISFPELVKAEVGANTTLEFSILNTGQADLTNLQIYFEDLPFNYIITQDYLDKISVGERKNFTLIIFIPENASVATYSPKIKVVSKELEASKNFGLTLIKTEKSQPQSGFVVKLPQINIDSRYSYLIIFAAISFSLAFFLKRVKKSRERRVNYDDIFSKLEVR